MMLFFLKKPKQYLTWKLFGPIMRYSKDCLMNNELIRRALSFTLFAATGVIILYYLLPNVNNAQHKPICAHCDKESVCMNTSFLGSYILNVTCIKIPQKAPIKNIMLPFSKDTSVFCTHSSGIGTHSWPNAYWALDLATPYHSDNAIVYASAKGIAYISTDNCKEPYGSPAKANVSNCGEGWGNWVKIYHGHGYYTFYAHLDSMLVKNGTFIHTGQPIGVEGWTGKAGHRHLHWSVQKLPGKTEQEWKQKVLTNMGDSVPFDFIAKFNNQFKKIDVKTLICENTSVDIDTDSIFSGTFESVKNSKNEKYKT
jgi:hypothetical protein